MSTKPLTVEDGAGPSVGVSPYAWYALGLLTLVYVLNFLDRTLIYILLAPIKAEMKFSGFELALPGSTSFTIFYTLLVCPAAGLLGALLLWLGSRSLEQNET